MATAFSFGVVLVRRTEDGENRTRSWSWPGPPGSGLCSLATGPESRDWPDRPGPFGWSDDDRRWSWQLALGQPSCRCGPTGLISAVGTKLSSPAASPVLLAMYSTYRRSSFSVTATTCTPERNCVSRRGITMLKTTRNNLVFSVKIAPTAKYTCRM